MAAPSLWWRALVRARPGADPTHRAFAGHRPPCLLEILAITFTNKAATEMKERVTAAVGPVGQRMWVSTFHSACVRILRRQAHHLGFPSSFFHLRHRRQPSSDHEHR